MPAITIIIPTLNEERFIAKTIVHTLEAAENPDALEILVVDAGSTDRTLACIAHLPVTAYSKPEFKLKKSESLNFGIAMASADIIQFLDADTLLPRHFDTKIREKMKDQRCVGGGFAMRFDKADWRLKLLTGLNFFRYHFWKTFYGDQAVFCRKGIAEKIGGFPPTLMESAYFCKSLKKYGRLTIIHPGVISSSRRFYEHGIWKVTIFDIRMWVNFVFGLDLKKHSKTYWTSNLENG